MAPLRTLAPLAALVATAFADPPTCQGGDLEFSCQNSTAVEDTCCFITSGQLVLTQFWDTDPVTGPDGTSSPPPSRRPTMMTDLTRFLDHPRPLA